MDETSEEVMGYHQKKFDETQENSQWSTSVVSLVNTIEGLQKQLERKDRFIRLALYSTANPKRAERFLEQALEV